MNNKNKTKTDTKDKGTQLGIRVIEKETNSVVAVLATTLDNEELWEEEKSNKKEIIKYRYIPDKNISLTINTQTNGYTYSIECSEQYSMDIVSIEKENLEIIYVLFDSVDEHLDKFNNSSVLSINKVKKILGPSCIIIQINAKETV